MANRLDELTKQGISHIATFVPWQAVESDISHLLPRFLQAASERKLNVSLILTPEVGVNYPNSGLPKDLFSRTENIAKGPRNTPVAVHLPPNAFALPSLLAPEVSKRYQNFLLRIDSLLSGLARNQPELLERVTAVLTGSFWKYYKGPTGVLGDYSGGASVTFRQRLETHFGQREFAGDLHTTSNRWKSRENEPINRAWFFQQSEAVFRARSAQFVGRKSTGVKMLQIDLSTPEANPEMHYSALLQAASGSRADFSRLSRLLDDVSTRRARADDQRCLPWIHWTELGGFRTLTDPEKQFLVIKSLLYVASQGGGVLIDEAEWFSLSSGFRTRVEALARLFTQGELTLEPQVLYLSPCLWSDESTLWEEVFRRVRGQVRRVATVDDAVKERGAGFLIVDPGMILNRDAIQRLSAWARSGRIVALPRTPLYTELALQELESRMGKGAIEVEAGGAFRVQSHGDGKLIVYDIPRDGSFGFVGALIAMGEILENCSVSDSRLQLIRLARKGSCGSGLFILNGTPRSVSGDLIFSSEVSISDLAATLWSHPANKQKMTALANRFALEVPPFGVLPVSIDGVGEAVERKAAAVMSDLTRRHADEAANNELPGLEAGGGPTEGIWS